jgi:hypothetical protein
MTNAEKYAEKKTIEKAEYPLADMSRQKVLTRFDAYDIEQAYEDGSNAMLDKACAYLLLHLGNNFNDNTNFVKKFRESVEKL